MYCTEFLNDIVEKGDTSKVEEFYFANYGLVLKFLSVFNVPRAEEDDFKQICFQAFLSALKTYTEGTKNTFLSYWRRCILHEYYCYKLEMRFPFCVKRSDLKRISEGGPELVDTILTDCCAKTYYVLDDELRDDEEEMLHTTVWAILEDNTTEVEIEILRRHFVDNQSIREINESASFRTVNVRSVYGKAMRRLRRCYKLKEIARDFYGIYC